MKQQSNTTPWYIVYHRLALLLNKFYRKHGEKAGPELYSLLYKSRLYKGNNSWLINVKRSKTSSVEPLQLFASFSRSKQKEQVRFDIIKELWLLLDDKPLPWTSIDFRGCPAPFAIKLQYIRSITVQSQIWGVFGKMVRGDKRHLTEEIWDSVETWRGIQIPSFTIFLFWIHAKKFIPLDRNTRLYLARLGKIQDTRRLSFEKYRELLDDRTISSYERLALDAYYYMEDSQFTGSGNDKPGITQVARPDNFKIIGLRTLNRNKNFHKILPEHEYFPFDQTFVPELRNKSKSELNSFSESRIDESNIHRLDNLLVNITAVVGKNGSGKSTLFDLLLMAIYNLSIKVGYVNPEKNKLLKRLNIEIFWFTDTLCSLQFTDEISLFTFQRIIENDKIKYQRDQIPIPFERLNFTFFYTILINYSHYALNSNEHAIDWITPLSHKNDGYLTPIVINPKREEGSIDINNEKRLLNMRLLLNMLELHDPDIPDRSFRYLDNGKYIKFFSIRHNVKKSRSNEREVKKQTYEDPAVIKLIINEVVRNFEIPSSNPPYKKELEVYIVRKIFKIFGQYEPYKEKYGQVIPNLIGSFITSIDGEFDSIVKESLVERVQELIADIKDDQSHITLKLKQAVYFLKYPALQRIVHNGIVKKEIIELDNYSHLINELINKSESERLYEAQLLPPAIFQLDFYFNDAEKSSLSKGSSGEYQVISVLSSILYHIRNIDSAGQRHQYNFISVLLDEIELYFHPNMQRLFIQKLLTALSKMDTELYGVNIMFATHSPFILSDIPQEKILKLDSGSIKKTENGYNTFAANLHDLLADEFFLSEGYMGAFAQNEIESAIHLLNFIIYNNELSKMTDSVKDKPLSEDDKAYVQKLEIELMLNKKKLDDSRSSIAKLFPNVFEKSTELRLHHLIEAIGEPVIRERLRGMFTEAFPDSPEGRESVKKNIVGLMQQYNIQLNELQ